MMAILHDHDQQFQHLNTSFLGGIFKNTIASSALNLIYIEMELMSKLYLDRPLYSCKPGKGNDKNSAMILFL